MLQVLQYECFDPDTFLCTHLFSRQPEIVHELELEIARPALLLSTAAKRGDPKASEHERNAFDELIRAFVNNARILVRNANGNWH